MVRSVFASLVTFVFSIVFFVSFTLFLFLNTLLSVDFYKGDLSESLYEAVVDVTTGLISSNKAEIEIPFSEKDLEKALRENISAEDFENVLVPFIQQLIEPEFDENGVAQISLDFSHVIDKLPNFVEMFASNLFDTMPPCEKGVVPSDENLCIPEGIPEEDFKDQVVQILNVQMLGEVPSKITVFELHEGDLELFAGYELNKSFLWKLWWATFLVQVLLLAIVALIILKPFHRVVRWVSRPLISGAVFTAVAFLGLYHVPKLVSSLASSDKMGENLNTDQVQSMMYFLEDFLGLLSTRALMYSAVIFVAGLAIYIIGLVMKHHSHD